MVPSHRAGRTATITHRDHPEEPVKVNLPADLAKSPQGNIEILPGDTIVVNRAGLVYVVGEVQRPSGLVMDNNEKMTVVQAPLKRMLSTKQPDVDLKPDDIIFVPASMGKKAAKRSVDTVLAVTQGLAPSIIPNSVAGGFARGQLLQ